MVVSDISELLGCGCYVLLWRSEVVYVGQSGTPLRRIGEHSKNIKFDRVWFVPCRKGDLLDLEDHLISYLRPKVNKKTIFTNGGIEGSNREPPMDAAEAKEFISTLREIPRAPPAGFSLVAALGLKKPEAVRRL